MTIKEHGAAARLTRCQSGLTIAELMISMALGLMVVMAALALLISSKSAYTTLDDAVRINDTGRYVLEIIARSVHQTSYSDWDREDARVLIGAAKSSDVMGLDAQSLTSATPNIQSPIQKAINGSDILAVRYMGSGNSEVGDETILNCAGFGVAPLLSADEIEDGRGWSIFYVAADKVGEPELRCKYQGKSGWRSEAIARGVESFQVLYGIDADADGLPNKFITATEVYALDENLELTSEDAGAKEAERSRKTNWKKVVAVKVALLVRGSQKNRTDAMGHQYDLFGSEYAHAKPNDIGATIKETNLPANTRNRARKIFQQTIMLRNRPVGGNT